MKTKLSQIANIYNGIRTPRYKKTNLKKQPIIKKIHNNGQYQQENTNISQNINKKFYTQKNDILIQITTPYTTIQIKKEGLIIPMKYAIIRTKPQYNPQYTYYAIKKELPKQINKIAEGTTNPKTIKITQLNQIKINLPKKEKQDKIAKTLELIEKRKKLQKKQIQIETKLQNTIINKIK